MFRNNLTQISAGLEIIQGSNPNLPANPLLGGEHKTASAVHPTFKFARHINVNEIRTLPGVPKAVLL
jgi:hypothetical protein